MVFARTQFTVGAAHWALTVRVGFVSYVRTRWAVTPLVGRGHHADLSAAHRGNLPRNVRFEEAATIGCMAGMGASRLRHRKAFRSAFPHPSRRFDVYAAATAD